MMNDPDIDLKNDSYMVIRGQTLIKFAFADLVIVTPPEKGITLPTEDVCFQLDSSQLRASEASSIYQLLISLPLVMVNRLFFPSVTRRMIILMSSL